MKDRYSLMKNGVMKSVFMMLMAALPLMTIAEVAGSAGKDWNRAENSYANALKRMAGDVHCVTNSDGWITQVDRRRFYEKLCIKHPISTQKWDGGIVNDEGRPTPVFPLEYVRVRCLEFDCNEITKKLGGMPFETIALTGVEDLETLVFKGEKIPNFEESSRWLGLAKDKDWRKNLKRAVVEKDINGVLRLPFISEVRCLELEESGVKELKESLVGGECKKLFENCSGLSQIVIPYALAVDEDIPWGEIIRRTSLRDTEVVSVRDDDRQNTVEMVLLNAAKSGKISDAVTTIRADAFNDQKRIELPYKLRCIIGNLKDGHKEVIRLKKDSVLFYPDIMSLKEKYVLQKSSSLTETSPLTITSAYENLKIRREASKVPGVGFVSGECDNLSTNGAVYVGTIDLYRGKDATNALTFSLGLEDQSLDVCLFTGAKKIEVKFSKPIVSKVGVAIRLLATWVTLVIVYFCSVFLVSKKWSRGATRCAIDICLILLGSALVILTVNGGFVQSLVDRYLTGNVMSYLNASFVSSLVISVLTTSLKLIVGLIQSVSASAIVISINLQSALQPVQDILEKISTYSWLSTGVLAFVRIFCQLVRDLAVFIWACLGISLVAYPFLAFCKEVLGWELWRKLLRACGYVITIMVFVGLGLPAFLCGCASLSGMVAEIAGSSFRDAMETFGVLAQQFQLADLTSIDQAKQLAVIFTDAMATLTSASMYYLANKAFDCFAVPLALYFVAKRILSGFGSRSEDELKEIRKLLEGPACRDQVADVPTNGEIEDEAKAKESEAETKAAEAETAEAKEEK